MRELCPGMLIAFSRVEFDVARICITAYMNRYATMQLCSQAKIFEHTSHALERLSYHEISENEDAHSAECVLK